MFSPEGVEEPEFMVRLAESDALALTLALPLPLPLRPTRTLSLSRLAAARAALEVPRASCLPATAYRGAARRPEPQPEP